MSKRFGTMFLAVLAMAIAGCVSPAMQAQDTAITSGSPATYVIRHLHKAEGDDPPLTSEGAAAAVRLATLLEGEGIRAIYATPTRRTMETAEPLARRLDIAITPYDPREPQALVDAVGALGGPVLVVGHSNTVPDLVERFGGAPVPRLSEDDYGTLFAIDAAGSVRSIQLD